MGNMDAIRFRTALERQLTPDRLAAARRRADKLRQKNQ
jgi:hypothetical protein